MDNDSTTIARAKSNFDPTIQKIGDFNHTKKNFTNKLYDLKKSKRYQILGPKTIKHLGKCFAYAVKSNHDASNLKRNFDSIPFHVFGDHSKSEEAWCNFIKDPEGYKLWNLRKIFIWRTFTDRFDINIQCIFQQCRETVQYRKHPKQRKFQ